MKTQALKRFRSKLANNEPVYRTLEESNSLSSINDELSRNQASVTPSRYCFSGNIKDLAELFDGMDKLTCGLNRKLGRIGHIFNQ